MTRRNLFKSLAGVAASIPVFGLAAKLSKPDSEIYGGGNAARNAMALSADQGAFSHPTMTPDPNKIPLLHRINYKVEGSPRVLFNGVDVTDTAQAAVPGENGWVVAFERDEEDQVNWHSMTGLHIPIKRLMKPKLERNPITEKMRAKRIFLHGHVEFVRP